MLHPLEHALYRIVNTPILKYPYPHFFVENVFPGDFFRELVSSLNNLTYEPLKGGYKARVATSEMPPCMAPFQDGRFTKAMLAMFVKQFYDRFPAHQQGLNLRSEWRFIRDSEGYSIGPHTDAPHKVLSMLFYLNAEHPDPGSISLEELNGIDYREYGTGIYVPEDGRKTCVGGPHHKFDGFREVWRAPFLSNSCFCFWKTANSWHAVEQISAKIKRDVLLFNIYEGAP